MLRRVFPIGFSLAALVCLASANATQERQPKKAEPEGTLDEQAREVAMKFCKAVLTKTDVDTAMNMVAVPFFHQDARGKVGNSLSTPLVANRLDEAKQEIAALITLCNAEKKYGDVLNQQKPEFEVMTDERLLLDGKTFGHVEFEKALNSALKKTDRIVTIFSEKKDEATGPKRVYVPFLTLVSWREGEAKVVGYALPLAFRQKNRTAGQHD
jgi:hypothetical protein